MYKLNFGWLPWVVLSSAAASIFFLFRRKLAVTLSIAGLLVTSGLYLSAYFHLITNSLPVSDSGKDRVKIISYNFYSRDSKFKRDKLSEIIKKYNPDIICLQEINSGDKAAFRNAFISNYPYQIYPEVKGNSYQGGIILSKLPFVTARNISISNRFKDSYLSMNFAKIKVDSAKYFALYNLHLISNGFAIRNSFSSRKVRNGVVDQERINYIKRLDEAKNTVARIDFSDKRIVLVGDFNDVLNSKVLRYFERNFKNAWYLAGREHHLTYGFRYVTEIYNLLGLPGDDVFNLVGIDHTFVSENVNVLKYYVLKEEKYSDHSPVYTEIIIE
jgi:endonuclease/exonuclease/phosphatase family metal-dependent hydrolase